MVALRPIIMGVGAAGAAATAIFTQPFRDADETQSNGDRGAYEVCLKTQMPLFEKASAKCYGHEALLALMDERILDLQGNPVTATMTHPSDMSVPSRNLNTCRDYRELSFDGWYAATTREMRREGYFVRACGALSAMFDAQAAGREYFTNGSPESEEVASLKGVLRIGETAADIDAVVVEQPGAFQWRIAADSQFVEIQELANADFDNDGIGEILVFLAGGTNGGSALFYDVGLIQKDAAEAPLEFSPLSLERDDAAGAAG
jgi:hypothetical protein